MTIAQSIEGGTALLTISGRLDTNTSPELEQVVAELFLKDITIIKMDIEHLGYISSAGLRVLLSTHKKCLQQSGHLTVRNAGEMARELFDMTGFSDILNLEQRQPR